ncbi:hypothetical protein PV963_25370 [Streptomyces coeruleorubidus]|uniref:PepSY domain-containing protein n=1 Tax=Streptomyces coeruleorubidus TaxID=116188 RepID=UPI00237F0401|nr:PepSY domain-containing protein [Streptomyces coeruleorubidus]WDV53456.1 hypothetical protein PV963_25370 [Streptomyces coeruleorubidus]
MARSRNGGGSGAVTRALRGGLALALAGVASATLLSSPSQAASGVNVGQRYNDGLDSRYSVTGFTSAATAMGYDALGYTGGRSATNTFNDGSGAAVLGLFGHANAGIFQTDEGPTDPKDEILAAGTATDVVSPYANLRLVSEYFPYAEVDDMRLMVLAGCYTSLNGSWGNFNDAAVSRGVDSVISFSGLVYFPATSSGTSISSTNYSGNYFWDRFGYHAKTGVTISTALSRARTDLVAKEGSAGGWNNYVIRGAVSNPAGVHLKPTGNGEPLNSQPLATLPFTNFSRLTPAASTTTEGPDGVELTDVTTAQGVQYRQRQDGTVLDAVGTPSTEGEVTLSAAEARTAAQDFAQTNVPGFGPDWRLVTDETVSHVEGDAVRLLRWRTVAEGRDAAREVTVELDQRTGAVVYFSAARGTADSAAFPVTAEQAEATARELTGDRTTAATVVADTWNASRWTVTFDRGLTGWSEARVPDADRVEIDARTGEALSRTTA